MSQDDANADATESSRTDENARAGASTRRGFLAGAGALGVGVLAAGVPSVLGQMDDGEQSAAATFTVRVENVSTPDTLQTTGEGEASAQPVPLSPGAYAVHTPDEPVFSRHEPERDNGLEAVAEDGMPGKLVTHLSERETVTHAGAFDTPVGSDGPGPLTPGSAYEFEVTAEPPASYLSLVTMFVPSNDLFYALGGAGGVRLFGRSGGIGASGNADGNASESGEQAMPVRGNVTDHVMLWDAGTEINEEPGVGENQVQRQRGPGVGLVERGTVAPVSAVNGYDYPRVEDVIRVNVTPSAGDGGDTGSGG